MESRAEGRHRDSGQLCGSTCPSRLLLLLPSTYNITIIFRKVCRFSNSQQTAGPGRRAPAAMGVGADPPLTASPQQPTQHSISVANSLQRSAGTWGPGTVPLRTVLSANPGKLTLSRPSTNNAKGRGANRPTFLGPQGDIRAWLRSSYLRQHREGGAENRSSMPTASQPPHMPPPSGTSFTSLRAVDMESPSVRLMFPVAAASSQFTRL